MKHHSKDKILLSSISWKIEKDENGKPTQCLITPTTPYIAIVTDSYVVDGKCCYDVLTLNKAFLGIGMDELHLMGEYYEIVAHEAYVLKLLAATEKDKWVKRRLVKQFEARCVRLKQIKAIENQELLKYEN